MNTYVVGDPENRLAEAILMSTHIIDSGEAFLKSTQNIDFHEEISKIIPKLSSNIIKYAHYLFV